MSDEYWTDERKKGSVFDKRIAGIRSTEGRVIKKIRTDNDWTVGLGPARSLSERQGLRTSTGSSAEHFAIPTGYAPEPFVAPSPEPPLPDRSYEGGGHHLLAPVPPPPPAQYYNYPPPSPGPGYGQYPQAMPPAAGYGYFEQAPYPPPAPPPAAGYGYFEQAPYPPPVPPPAALYQAPAPEVVRQPSEEEIDARAFFCPQSQAYNFRYILRRLETELVRARFFGRNVAILVISVDRFESIALEHGPALRDKVIDSVAALLIAGCRCVDSVGRYVDGRFLIVCPELAGEQAADVARRILNAADSAVVRYQWQDFPLSLSIGIAVFPVDADDLESMIAIADLGADMACERGGNAVCSAAEEA
jgi:diguanylate cyclase (GGDEF)-like protein